jgi:hypothetical protein
MARQQAQSRPPSACPQHRARAGPLPGATLKAAELPAREMRKEEPSSLALLTSPGHGDGTHGVGLRPAPVAADGRRTGRLSSWRPLNPREEPPERSELMLTDTAASKAIALG